MPPRFFSAAEMGEQIAFFRSWGGALAYTLQLYFDFSGYSDMAIGCARLFGIKLPLNFHSPYKALNITEFWRRWHMTLSRFLRDYIYISLGGNRKGTLRRYGNLFATMLLGGLWHGAGWTFVVWGALHGVYLMINHFWHFVVRKLHLGFLEKSPVWRGFSWALTFSAVVGGWVFFRAESFDSALLLLKSMSGQNGFSLPNGLVIQLASLGENLTALGLNVTLGGGKEFVMTSVWILLLLPTALLWPNTQQIMDKFEPALIKIIDNPLKTLMSENILMRKVKFTYSTGWAVAMSFILTIGILAISQISEFLYFQF